eukprot:NODE_462_length_8172_cov_0.295181.p6 type:complete len:123 gc:universal NODE_462_length_8172_cov_0.295181:5773-5405(-)
MQKSVSLNLNLMYHNNWELLLSVAILQEVFFTNLVFCTLVSHPADTLVSKMNNAPKQANESSFQLASRISKDLGFSGLWTGLGTRILMVGTLTALQWLIYDSFKVYTGLPTTGGVVKVKEVK